MTTVYFITSNAEKIDEVRQWLTPTGVTVHVMDIAITESLMEDLEELIRDKAARAWNQVRLPLLVEHGGLYLDHFKGLPGPHVKPWWDRLGGAMCDLVPPGATRAAHARSAVCFCDGRVFKVKTHTIPGQLAASVRGQNEVHWGRAFVPDGHTKTLGEMNFTEREQISPRASALLQVANELPQWLSSTSM